MDYYDDLSVITQQLSDIISLLEKLNAKANGYHQSEARIASGRIPTGEDLTESVESVRARRDYAYTNPSEGWARLQETRAREERERRLINRARAASKEAAKQVLQEEQSEAERGTSSA